MKLIGSKMLARIAKLSRSYHASHGAARSRKGWAYGDQLVGCALSLIIGQRQLISGLTMPTTDHKRLRWALPKKMSHHFGDFSPQCPLYEDFTSSSISLLAPNNLRSLTSNNVTIHYEDADCALHFMLRTLHLRSLDVDVGWALPTFPRQI